ncbi:hypothetical protein [Sphaerisporangium fuscum]|uniref:hypothetical protein n=1 Tax=Sphaerisporangium fuscum TaxID=2835868 RepID=UPI001BDC9C8D|nr:hypothetical protein [Sphaerisporangium fuscum]
MRRLGPFHTLTAGVVLAAGLGVASWQTAPRADTPAKAVGIRATMAGDSLTAATPTPAPAADPTPRRADYAGVVQGNGGLLALSIKNGKAVAYFCDGRRESWLKGTAENGTATLTGKNDALLTAALTDTKAKGRLQVGKASWRFTAKLVTKPSGLYRATAQVRGAKIVGGWIILPDGRQVGLLKLDDSPYPTPALTPGSPLTIDGATLRPQDADEFIDAF